MVLLNGINHTGEILTTEELAVIKAMRKGADVSVSFYRLNEIDEVDERMDLFGEIKKDEMSWIEERKVGNMNSYISFFKRMNKISVTCFLQTKKD